MTDQDARFAAEMRDQYHEAVMTRLGTGDVRMDAIEQQLAENTKLTHELKADTAELLEILQAGKSGLKVLGGLGALVKWVASVAAAIGALWGIYHGKFPGQ